MTPELLLSLAGLALIDSTSIGTLFIPVWLLLTPGPVNVRRILGYLATIAVFYLAVGLLLVWGGSTLGGALGGALDNRGVLWAQLVLGVGMLVLSFRYDGKRRPRTGGVLRWRDRATAGDSSPRWLVGLALLAGARRGGDHAAVPRRGSSLLATARESGAAGAGGRAAPATAWSWVLPAVLLLGCQGGAPALVEPVLAAAEQLDRHEGGQHVRLGPRHRRFPDRPRRRRPAGPVRPERHRSPTTAASASRPRRRLLHRGPVRAGVDVHGRRRAGSRPGSCPASSARSAASVLGAETAASSGMPGHPRLLGQLEAGPAGDQQHVPGQRQPAAPAPPSRSPCRRRCAGRRPRGAPPARRRR